MTRRFAALLCSLALPALAETPIPPYPQDGVAVGGVEDRFAPLREHLRRFRSSAGADYRVAVVRFTDPQDRPGREHAGSGPAYAERTFERWRASLDPARSLVIVLALENRAIAVQPGSKWVALGFEAEAITRVIDESPFGTYARAGDHVAAIERLIEAIDMHLSLLMRVQQRGLDAARKRLAGLRSLAAEQRSLAASSPDGESVRPALEEAATLLAAADGALGREESTAAGRSLDLAEQRLREVAREIAAARAAREEKERLVKAAPVQLRAARERAERLGRELEATALPSEELAPAKEELARVVALLRDADALLAAGDAKAVVERAARADDWLQRVDQRREQALAAQRFRTRTLPLIAAGGALSALGLLLLVLRIVRRVKVAAAKRAVDDWRRQLQVAAPRLLQLEDEHPLLFGTPELGARLRGKTAELFRQVGEASDDLFLAWGAAQERLTEAESALARTPPLGWGPADRALLLLTKTPVESGKKPAEGTRLFLPAGKTVTRAPGELLDHLERAWEGTKARVHELESLLTRVPARLGSLQERHSALVTRVFGLAARGLASKAWDLELSRLEQALQELRLLAPHDPATVEGALVDLEDELAMIDGRLARTDQALELAGKTEEALAAEVARIAAQRAIGVALLEPGFEPEALIEAARQALAGSRAAADAAEDERAQELAVRAADVTADLTARVEDSLQVRAQGASWIAELRGARALLDAALPERRARLAALRHEHADAALCPALDNAEEAAVALAFAARCLEEAEAALSVQRHLAAAELVTRARAVLGQVQALYVEVESKAAELAAARQAAEAARAAAKGDESQVELLVAPGDRFLTLATLGETKALVAALGEELALQGAERPHWPERRAASEELQRRAARVLARVRQEHHACQEAERELQRARDEHHALVRLLQSSQDDRPLANQRAAEGQRCLQEVKQLAAGARPDWVELLSLVTAARGHLKDARGLAERDISLARAAREAFAHGQSSIDSRAGGFGRGVSADLGGARSVLEQARVALASQQYEAAARLSLEAQGQAEAAEREARRRVRELEEAEERRRREAEAERQRRARASTGFSFASSSSSSSSRSSSSSFGSSRSSSSGGSSFSRSAGGSSFKRSAGGSSW